MAPATHTVGQPREPARIERTEERELRFELARRAGALTCAPQSYRRMAGHTTYLQEPPCEQACVHEPRVRDANDLRDDVLSDWEMYLARPAIAGGQHSASALAATATASHEERSVEQQQTCCCDSQISREDGTWPTDAGRSNLAPASAGTARVQRVARGG